MQEAPPPWPRPRYRRAGPSWLVGICLTAACFIAGVILGGLLVLWAVLGVPAI